MKKISVLFIMLALSIGSITAQPVVKKNSGGTATGGTTTPAATTSQPAVVKKNAGGVATPATPAAPAKSAKKGGMTGKICTMLSCASGKPSYPSKEEANRMASRGEILCVMVGKKCYIVVNGDGTNASNKLANYAGGNVTITGKSFTKGGMSVIVADSMQ